MRSLLRDFRDFALKGNVVDLAVAVVIGVAFNAIVTSLVNDVIMPVIAAIFGKPNFDDLAFTISSSPVHYGKFLTAVVNFVIVAFTLFVVVRSFEALQRRTVRIVAEPPAATPSAEVTLLTEIRDLLRDGAPSTPAGGPEPDGPAVS